MITNTETGQERLPLYPFVVFLPIPLTSFVARITGVDSIGLLGVLSGCLLAHWILKKQGRSWSDVGFRRKDFGLSLIAFSLVAAVGLLVGTSIAGSLMAQLINTTPDLSKFDILRGDIAALIVGLILVWTTAAFGEELLFRGFLLNEIARWTSRSIKGPLALILALLLSSVLFGIAHSYQGLAGMILTGVAGAGFGAVYLIRNKKLWAAILTHGLYDTIAFLLVFSNFDKMLAGQT